MVQKTDMPDFHKLFSEGRWRKICLYKTDHPQADGYLYKGSGYAFNSEEELQEFLNSFCGTIVPEGKDYTVWCCCDVIRCIPREEWQAIESPIFQRIIDRQPVYVKTIKDLECFTVFTYYFK